MIELHIGKSKYKLVRIVEEKFKTDISGHRHGPQSYEIHYCLNGVGELATENDYYSLEEGVLYITGPNVWHSQLINNATTLCELCLYIQITSSGNDILSKNFNSTHFWIGNANVLLKNFFQCLYNTLHIDSIYSKEIQKHLVELIVSELSHLYSASFVAAGKDIPDDKKFIIIEEAFLYDYANITIDELAMRIGLSVRQTQRILKQYYGVTFRDKCIKSRMEAAQLLLKKGKRVNQVAREVGYANTPSFIRAFKNLYNKTPTKVIKTQ